MKKPAIIIFFFLSTLPAFAQEQPEIWEVIDSLPRNQVPVPVQQAFKVRYAGIRPLFWFQLNDDFEAQFIRQERSMSAEFSKTGKWINTETIIPEEEFPDKIIDYVRQNFSTFELDTVVLEESPAGRFYDVTIANEEADQELVFDDKCNFLRPGDSPE